MQRKHYMVPDYVLRFKCSECSKCCKGWHIRVDRETMKHYEGLAVNDKNFAKELEDHIFKKEDGTGKIIFIDKYTRKPENSTGEMVCPFLTEEGLCSIQKRFGLDALYDVAKQYPRTITLTERGLEIALDFSCPTASELLKEKNQVVFCIDPEGFEFVDFRGGYNVIAGASERKEIGKADYFKLEKILTDVMLNRNYVLGKRLILIGIIIDRVNNDYIKGIDTCMEEIEPEMEKQIKELNPSPENMISLIKEAIDRRIMFPNINKTEVHKLFGIPYIKLRLLNETEITEKKIEGFLEGYYKYYKPFEEDISHIYENYFVNYIFSKRFYSHLYMDSYFLMVFLYSTIRFITICECMNGKQNVNEDLVIDTIRIIDHSMGHMKGYYEDFIQSFKTRKDIDISYIFSLII